MPSPIFNRFAACFLALLLLFGGTAKEALHHFAQHEDTAHRHNVDGLSFETEHHHCGALSAFIAAFESPALQAFHAAIVANNAPVLTEVLRSLTLRKVLASGLRGPPAG